VERDRLRLMIEAGGWTRTREIVLGLRAAAREGRLDPELAAAADVETGAYRCRICGMLSWTALEAATCCGSAPEVELDRDTRQRHASATRATAADPRSLGL